MIKYLQHLQSLQKESAAAEKYAALYNGEVINTGAKETGSSSAHPWTAWR